MNENTKDLITFRDSRFSDKNCISGTWLPSLYYGNEWFKEIDTQTYFDKYLKVIELILSKSSVRIACLKEDLDVVLGYSVNEYRNGDTILHFIYTKPAWRKIGIAKSLLPEGITVVTHLTKIGRSIKPKEWKFDPFLI